MFGYGRVQNAAALVAATLFISFTSLRLYEEAIPRLLRPAAASYHNLNVAVLVLVVSMLVAAAPLLTLFRRGSRGAAATAQYVELIDDALGLLAALVGTLFIARGFPLADPLAAVIVATIIAFNGVRLFRANVSMLLGRSPGGEFLAEIEQIARSVDGVQGVHDLRAEYVGPDVVHAGLHVEVAAATSIEEADQIARAVHDRVEQAVGCQYCVIHIDPPGGPPREGSPRAPAVSVP